MKFLTALALALFSTAALGEGRIKDIDIASNAGIALPKLQSIAANTFLGNKTGSSGAVGAMTVAEAAGLILTAVDAFDIDYTPTNIADWSVAPDNIGDALDELAARDTVDVTDTNSINLTDTSGNISADLRLSAAAADSGNINSITSIETDGLQVQSPILVGASNVANGAAGVAPQPLAGDEGKFLRGDGTWVTHVGGADRWSLTGNAGTTPGTNFVGTSDAQDLHIKTNGLTHVVYDKDGGWASSQTEVPADATSKNQYDLRTYASPSASTAGANHTNLYSQLVYDNPSADFGNSGGSMIANQSSFVKNGTGTINFAGANLNAGQIDEGVVTQFNGVTSETTVASGAEVTGYNGFNATLNTTGGTVGPAYLYNSALNYTDVTATFLAGVNSNFVFNGTTAFSQGVSSYSGYQQYNGTSSTANSAFGFTSGIDLNGSANVANLYGTNSYFNVRDTSTPGQVYGNNVGVTLEDDSVTDSLSGLNMNIQAVDNAEITGGATLANLYMKTDNNAVLGSFTGINLNPELEGTSSIDNITMAGLWGQLRGSATADNFTGLSVGPQMSGSASSTNFTGMNLTPTVTGTSTVTNPITALNLNMTANNTGGVAGATAIDINMDNVNLSSAAIAAGGKKKAIGFGGSIEGGNNYTVPGAVSFFQNHYIGGTVGVASGDPIAAFGFGTNLAQTIDFQDDWTADGGGLGFANVGFVGAIAGATGKTMYSWTGALGGAGNPSGAGTVTNAKMFSAAGILPQGGSLSVTNMYGFEVNPNTFCAIGTNCWGFFEDGGAENAVSKLAIDTSNNKVFNSSTALEIGSVKALLNGRGTTTQKNALTAAAGMQFYDTTLNELQWYNGSSWVTASGSGSAITELTGDVTAGPGSGSQAATIAADAVTNSKLANMAQATIKGRASGAGTGDPTDLTGTQATAILDNFVGDSGSGGTKGLVPAPASGDAAANKFLKADGTWAVAGTSSPLTTKGDIYVYGTGNDRLPVGADGEVLVADSGEALGVKWAAASGGGGQDVARFVLEGAVVPYTSIDGPKYQSGTQTLSTVNISALNSGTTGSTTVQVNQYRAGVLHDSETASLSSSSGNPNGGAAALSGSLSLIAGDILTVDVVSAAAGASDLTVEWGTVASSAGGNTLTVLTKTADYTLTNSDDVLAFNCSSDCTLTLHSAATATSKRYSVKNIGTGALTINRGGSDTIDGDTSIVLPAGGIPQSAIDLIPSGGTAWYVF